jgi:hypothetical protein
VDPAADLGRTLLAETREELDRADRKAQILFAAAGIGVSAVLGGIAAGRWSPFVLEGWSAVSWWAGAALVLFGMFLLALAVFPRVKHSEPQGKVAYFGHVASYPTVEALTAALHDAATDLHQRTLDQLLTISRIVVRKYGLISWGLWMVGIGILLALLAVVGQALAW